MFEWGSCKIQSKEECIDSDGESGEKETQKGRGEERHPPLLPVYAPATQVIVSVIAVS